MIILFYIMYVSLFTLSNTCSWVIYIQNTYTNYMHTKVQMSSVVYNTNADEIGRIHIQRLISIDKRNFNIMQFYLIIQIIYINIMN